MDEIFKAVPQSRMRSPSGKSLEGRRVHESVLKI